MEFIRKNVNGGTSTSASSGSGGFSNTSGSGGTLESHTIFGQPYDGTNDVRGDMSDVDNISANGDIALDGKIIIRGQDEDGIYNNDDLIIERDKGTNFLGGFKYTFDDRVIAPLFIGNLQANNIDVLEGQIKNLYSKYGEFR